MFFLTSPIEARHDGSFVIFLVFGIIFLLIAFGVSVVITILQKKQKQKFLDPNRKTTKKDIEYVAKKINLTDLEQKYLQHMCKKHDVKNLYLTIRDIETINEIFKNEYQTLNNYNEEAKAIFFELRTKIDLHYNSENFLTSTRYIEPEKNLVFLWNDDKYLSKVVKTTEEGFIVRMPQNILGEYMDVKNLTRVPLMFSSKSNAIAYKLQARVLRPQLNGAENCLLIAHSNNIQVVHRRHQGRLPFDSECKFHAVQIAKDDKGKGKKYKILEKEHDGKLTDISANGCGLSTKLPIKEKQRIYLEVQINKDTLAKIFGIIVGKEFNKYTELYTLHIKFEKMDLRVQNIINSLLYEYEKCIDE